MKALESEKSQHSNAFTKALAQRPEAVFLPALVKLRLHSLPLASDIVDQSKSICRDYIYHTLRRRGLISEETADRQAVLLGSHTASDVAQDFCATGAELETAYGPLYKNVSKQMGLNLVTRDHLAYMIQKKLRSFAEVEFKSGGVVTWGRIISLMVVCGALAAEFVHQGRTDLVRVIVDSFAEVTAEVLAPWIIQQDGWPGISRLTKSAHDVTVLWILLAFGALFGFAMTLFITQLR